jgi:hypothetical protein
VAVEGVVGAADDDFLDDAGIGAPGGRVLPELHAAASSAKTFLATDGGKPTKTNWLW